MGRNRELISGKNASLERDCEELQLRLAQAEGRLRALECGVAQPAEALLQGWLGEEFRALMKGAAVSKPARSEGASDPTLVLGALLKNTRDLVWSRDREGRLMWGDAAVFALMGEAEAVLGRTLLDTMGESAQTRRIVEHDEEVMLSGRPGVYEEWFGPPGAARLYECSRTPLVDAEGRVIGVAGISHDITESKRLRSEQEKFVRLAWERLHVEKALRESEKRLELALSGADLGVWDWDVPAGTIQYDSRGADMLGYSLEEAGGAVEFWEGLIHPEDAARVMEAIKEHFSGRCPDYRMEYRLRHKAGHWVWMLVSGRVVERDAQGLPRRACGIHFNISERKAAEAQLYEAKEAAERANRAKDDFLAALSHELRTPLNPVLLLTSSHCKDPSLSEAMRADFDSIRRAVQLQAQIIDDLLDITRIGRGKLQMVPAVIDAHAVLREAFEVVCGDAAEQNLHVEFQLDAPAHHVRADPVRLQQVFWNLLRNAVKFTPAQGSIFIRTHVHSGTAQSPQEEAFLRIEIRDTGKGICPENLERVFHPFAQEAGAPRGFGGLGLGLAISRRLIEMQGGRIWAHSEGRGCGARFFVELPLVKAPEAKARMEGTDGPVQVENAVQRILLVEDHEPTRTTLSKLLRRRGHTVGAADTLAAARALAAAEAWDVVVSDLGLPDGSGNELMHELKERYGLPGIALSGYGMPQDQERSREAGFGFHLVKPVSLDALEQALEAVRS